MKHNPYGASCGTSMVLVPSNSKPPARIGTVRARLTDTKSGRAPKPIRSKEELEAMERHPAGKGLTKQQEALTHAEGCKCYCTVVKRSLKALVDALKGDEHNG